MRMSCNGCRVLRKGCSDDCSIRPCLQWIKNPESQGNATVFLAKFYGRAGLLNLINAGPEHLRPAIFRSLLYEACGRIVNPIYGSVGLLWSGSWQLCQAAVEAVLKGAPVLQIPVETAASTPMPPLKAFDIRHVPKDDAARGFPVHAPAAAMTAASHERIHKVAKASRTRFKRSGATTTSSNNNNHDKPKATTDDEHVSDLRAHSHESSGSHEWGHTSSGAGGGFAMASPAANEGATAQERESPENDSMVSDETADGSMVTSHGKSDDGNVAADDGEVQLELTLGLGLGSSPPSQRSPPKRCEVMDGRGVNTCTADLALDLRA